MIAEPLSSLVLKANQYSSVSNHWMEEKTRSPAIMQLFYILKELPSSQKLTIDSAFAVDRQLAPHFTNGAFSYFHFPWCRFLLHSQCLGVQV